MATQLKSKPYTARGTDAPWYRGWELDESERERFRKISRASKEAKDRAQRGECLAAKHPIPTPALDPETLMPLLGSNGLCALSLFSGGGGLDIGFERAGYEHVASFEILSFAGEVLRAARPDWRVFSGDEGDVTQVDWTGYKGSIDVLHGGPPCQPFSHAGNRRGADDVRDMIPELVRAVQQSAPRAFVCENVAGLATKRFKAYLDETVFGPLAAKYHIRMFTLEASQFGVPQRRKRVFIVGFADQGAFDRFAPPLPTHEWKGGEGPQTNLPRTLGAREALGLPKLEFDYIAPTIRSGLTGPRHSTSIVNSATALRDWNKLQIWPNGVAPDREAAASFVAKNGDFRLSIADCMVLQCFPGDWPFKAPVYKALGLIGNSVAPPMGYAVAASVADALRR